MTSQITLCSFTEWRDTPHANAPLQPLVIDVREPWELQTARIEPDGFTLICIPMRDIPQHIAALRDTYGQTHPIACLCHHGVRSLQVANYLTHNGFTEVVNLQGGIDAWSKQIDAGVPIY